MTVCKLQKFGVIRPISGKMLPLHNMVAELGSELLPDAADANARVKVCESLYGVLRCAMGFVAMRLERSNEAPTETIVPVKAPPASIMQATCLIPAHQV